MAGDESQVVASGEPPTVAPIDTSMLFSSFESTIFEPNRMLRRDTAIPSAPAATPADRISYASTNVGVEHVRCTRRNTVQATQQCTNRRELLRV